MHKWMNTTHKVISILVVLLNALTNAFKQMCRPHVYPTACANTYLNVQPHALFFVKYTLCANNITRRLQQVLTNENIYYYIRYIYN